MTHFIEDIYTSSLKLLIPSTLPDLYKTIVEEAIRLTKSDRASLFFVKGQLLQRAYSTVPAHLQVKPRKNGYIYKCYHSAQTIIISRSEMQKNHPTVDPNIKTFIAVPLFYSNEPTAILGLQTRRNVKKLTQTEIQTLRLFGSFASLAIKKTQAQYETQKALESRDIFISMAAHELRTPITVIKLYAQMLYKRFSASQSAEQKWIGNILKETNRTVQIVNELLHVDQVRVGKLTFQHDIHSVRSIISEAIADSRMSYPDHEFIIEDLISNQSDLVVGDSSKLTQALINVINNAAKFSPLHSTITIRINRTDRDIQLTIVDQGPGIDPDELTHVFEAFFKGKKNVTIEGMGLGLSLVKKIIENSRGKINVSSEKSVGTTVSIQLPAAG